MIVYVSRVCVNLSTLLLTVHSFIVSCHCDFFIYLYVLLLLLQCFFCSLSLLSLGCWFVHQTNDISCHILNLSPSDSEAKHILTVEVFCLCIVFCFFFFSLSLVATWISLLKRVDTINSTRKKEHTNSM